MSNRSKMITKVESIPLFRSKYGLRGLEDKIIRKKLEHAYIKGYKESNSDFVMVSRGEGGYSPLEYILSDNLFVWGIKDSLAESKEELLQDLLGPKGDSKEFLSKLLNEMKVGFEYYIENRNKWKVKIELTHENVSNLLNELKAQIDCSKNAEEILTAKYCICIGLHLLNHYGIYRTNKIFISAQQGLFRYDKALRFAQGINKENKNFALLDFWIRKSEYAKAQYYATEFYDLLKKHYIKWFDIDKKYLTYEVLIKYALIPHRIIGYYYYEDNELKHYEINPSYIDKWVSDENFAIGDNIFISQDLNMIDKKFPYNMIYSINDKLEYDIIKLKDK